MNHNSIGGERVPETWVVEELIKEGKHDTTKKKLQDWDISSDYFEICLKGPQRHPNFSSEYVIKKCRILYIFSTIWFLL